MKLALSTILERAKNEPAHNGRICVKKWLPVCDELRRKDWPYRDIYEWLKGEGERVHDDCSKFTPAMSQAYNRFLEKLRVESIQRRARK